MALLYQFFWINFLNIIALGFAIKMDVIHEWKFIDYVWESPKAKEEAVKSGNYNFMSPILIIDVDRSRDRRTFVTVVRRKGVPASLGVVSNERGPGGPLIKPYPDWSWHKQGDCNNISNVYRVAICNKLWVLDNGMIDDKQICSAQLLVFNLTTNQLINRVKIADTVSKNPETLQSLLITPVVQTEDHNWEKSKVFIADVAGNGLVVVNLPNMWRLDRPYFAPDPSPNSVISTIAGETFTLNDGLFGLALSPKIGRN